MSTNILRRRKHVGCYSPFLTTCRSKLHIRSQLFRDAVGEFFGTFLLSFLSVGSGITSVSDNASAPILAAFGDFLAYFVAMLVAGGLSGGHVNPAITLALAVIGKLNWLKVPWMFLWQYIGCYTGSVCAALMYKYQADDFIDPGTGLIYCSAFARTGGFADFVTGLGDQMVTTAIIVIAFFSLVNPSNLDMPRFIVPILFSLVIACVNFAYNVNAGSPVNPAKDLMARVAAITMGCPGAIFWENNKGDPWAIVGALGPFGGAIVGALIYAFLIGSQLPDPDEYDAVYGGPSFTSLVDVEQDDDNGNEYSKIDDV